MAAASSDDRLPEMLRIRIPNLAAAPKVQPPTHAPANGPRDLESQFRPTAPLASSIDGELADDQPPVRRRWSFWRHPQAALAAIVIAMIALLGIVALSVSGRPDPSTDTAHDNSEPLESWRLNYASPIREQESGPTAEAARLADIPSASLTGLHAPSDETPVFAPNRPARLGNGPLATMHSADADQPVPNSGVRLSEGRQTRGVASLKGYLQNQLTAEATHERDRPGLR